MPNWIRRDDLLAHLKETFALDWNGIHGIRHWRRVHINATLLADRETLRLPSPPISRDVLWLFAFLHDHKRREEHGDPDHGERASISAATLAGVYFEISAAEMKLLTRAMTDHSKGFRIADLTVQICWDADRLDLGRVGIHPHPSHLCTPTALLDTDFLEAAYQRSVALDA